MSVLGKNFVIQVHIEREMSDSLNSCRVRCSHINSQTNLTGMIECHHMVLLFLDCFLVLSKDSSVTLASSLRLS